MKSPMLALRPEPFGALAYHFQTRKLVFLKHPSLVQVVDALDGQRTLAQAFDAADVPQQYQAQAWAALTSLAAAKMIRPKASQAAASQTKAPEAQLTAEG